MKESNYGESTEAFLWITQSNGRNKFGIANFLMRKTKKSPAEAGQKTIFFRLESKARDISDYAYLHCTNVLPQAQEHFSTDILNLAAIRLRFFSSAQGISALDTHISRFQISHRCIWES